MNIVAEGQELNINNLRSTPLQALCQKISASGVSLEEAAKEIGINFQELYELVLTDEFPNDSQGIKINNWLDEK